MQGRQIKQINNIRITQLKTGVFVAWSPGNIELYRDINYNAVYNWCSKCDKYVSKCKNYRSVPRKEYIRNQREMQEKQKQETLHKRKEIEQSILGGEHLLFHGSIGGIQGRISCDKNKALCDFGKGFYTGTSLKQAENRVANSSNSILYAYKFNPGDCKVYKFDDDVLWALYIGYNRKLAGFNMLQLSKLEKVFNDINSHDIIIGKIADDKISMTYTEFMTGAITDKCLSACLELVKYGSQVVFKNEASVDKSLKLRTSYLITQDIKSTSIEWNRKLKSTMNEDLSRLRKEYRRIGKYIDECMEDYK